LALLVSNDVLLADSTIDTNHAVSEASVSLRDAPQVTGAAALVDLGHAEVGDEHQPPSDGPFGIHSSEAAGNATARNGDGGFHDPAADGHVHPTDWLADFGGAAGTEHIFVDHARGDGGDLNVFDGGASINLQAVDDLSGDSGSGGNLSFTDYLPKSFGNAPDHAPWNADLRAGSPANDAGTDFSGAGTPIASLPSATSFAPHGTDGVATSPQFLLEAQLAGCCPGCWRWILAESQGHFPSGVSFLGGDDDDLGSGRQALSSGGSGTTGTGAGTGAVLGGSDQSSAFVININWDSSVSSAPAAFKTVVNEVVQYYESLFNNPITVNIDVGYGEVNGSSLSSGALGESLYYENAYTYSQVYNALQANHTPGANTLSSTDPTGGGWFFLTTSEAKAIGLASGSSVDGFIGFDGAANAFDYNNSDGVAAGEYDIFGTIAHEISEVMGRMIPGGGYYSPLDLFDYAASGVRDLSGTPPAYFSLNGGVTNLANFNTNASGDYGDWAGSVGADAYLAFANSGVVLPVSNTDIAVMTALGWSLQAPAAPTITTDTLNTGNTVTLAGTAIAQGTVAIYDGSTLLGTTTVADSGSWSFTTGTLAGGTHNITATVSDPGGTSSASNTVDPVIGSTAPTISTIAETPATGDLNAGKVVTFTLTMSEVVTVNTAGGTPTLTLNDGGTATYVGGSGTSALTFSYTVGAGQTTAGLAAAAINLNSATITDGSGNVANLSLSGLTQNGPQIDTTAPTITAISESPASGDLNAGRSVTFTLTLSEAVNVNTTGGSPTLTLNDGGAATYVSGSGTNTLTFSYTVGAGQNTAGLAATTVNLNSAAIADGAGNTANLSLSGLSQNGPQIDTTAPTISALVVSPSSGDLNAGKTVSFTLTLSEIVNVTGGTPTLTLNDGGTATYMSGSGTNALTFSYTVGAGQNISSLAATSLNLNTAALKDGAGNAANVSLSGLTQSGPQIDTNAPSITAIAESPASGDLGTGKSVTLILTLSEAVTVNTTGGAPTLTLNDGGTATYVSGSGTNTLTFSYTVSSSQNTAGLAATTVNLNSATIADAAGNNASLSLSGVTQTGPQIDTTAPAISAISESPATGELGTGQTVTFTLTLSEAVTVNTTGGSPTITLNDGGTATYVSGSGTNALTFSYTVSAGQNTAGLAATAVNLNSAIIADGAGNAANLSLSGLTQAGPQINTNAPSIVAIAESPSSGDFDAGKTVTFTLNLSEAVTVTTTGGTPTLTLNDGGTATYVSGSGTSTLTFSYTVGAGQHTAGLVATTVNLNSATIADGAGNAANLSLSGLTQNGPQIDTTAPIITAVSESPASGDLGSGKTVTFTLALSETVTVNTTGGSPTLMLNDGGTATYVGGSGTNTLTFSYTVGAGQNIAGLAATSLNLNSATIADGAGNAVNPSLSGLTQTGPQIDTTAPSITAISESPANGDLNAGKTVTFTLSLSEIVTVNTTGGAPTLTLNDGGTATYVGGSGTNVLTFSYTVGAGQSTSALAATAVNLNAATVADGAGNTANLSLSGLTQNGPQVDTTAPTITAVSESPTSGDLGTGKTVTFTLTLSEVVTVNTTGGTPTLALNDGGSASYVGGSGTNALTFSYTIGAGQNTSQLAATTINLNAATIKDGAGNTANLSLTGLTQTGPQIDTTKPTISSIVESPSSGDFSAGKTVTFSLTLSEIVSVSGGTPTLTLNDGGSAAYISGSGTNTLTFSYTVGAGQNSSSLAVSAVNLNSATIADGAGNAASLSLGGLTQSGPQIDTTAPSISLLTESPSSGDLNAGKTVTFTLHMSEVVAVSGGAPTLTLNDGGTASYLSGSGTSSLTFTYTVSAGQSASSLAATAINLNSATVADGAGNAANLSLAGISQSGPQIDTAAPSITSISESPSAGDLNAGKVVTIALSMSEIVTVNTAGGTPTLTLNDGATATYTGGSGTNTLTFSYTVGAGQSASSLAATAVNLNSATITDGAGNVANLSLNGLTQHGPQIDTSTPTISALTESPASGDLGVGTTVTFTLSLNEVVTVAGGTPTLTLNDGGTAVYVSGSGTNTITFSYTVGAGQSTSSLAATAINLNSATIADGAGNAANLSLSGVSQTGPQIDTAAPSITSISESPSSGDLNAGKVVTITLNMSEVVTVNTVGGNPTLTLNDGGTATYTGGSGTNALSFSYTVQAGQNTPDLMETAVNLNGATITDSVGNAANLSLAGLPQGSPQIDTTTPSATALAESPTSGDLGAGNTVTFTLTMSEVVTVSGTPTLELNDGGIATYVSGSGTDALTFSYTVVTGHNIANLAATTLDLNSGTIIDGAGNVAASQSLSGVNQAGPQIQTGPQPEIQISQIDEIYQAVLQRAPSSAEVTAALALDSTFGSAGIVASLVDSSEAIANVYPILQMFDLAFGHFPAAATLASMVETGLTVSELVGAIVASPTFAITYNGGKLINPNSPVTAAIVEAFYSQALGHAPSQATLNGWLASGMTVAQAFEDMVTSQSYFATTQLAIEQYLTTAANNNAGFASSTITAGAADVTTTQISAIYEAVLQRAPTANEMTASLALDSTTSNAGMIAALVNAPEAVANAYPILQMFNLAFGYFPTTATLASMVETGLTLSQLAAAVVASQTFANVYNGGTPLNANSPVTAGIVETLYSEALGHAPSQATLNGWLTSGLTIAQAFQEMVTSDSYFATTQAAIEQYLIATAINQAGLTTINGTDAAGGLTLGALATPLTASGLTVLGGSGTLTVVASGAGDTLTELSTSTAGGTITANGAGDTINAANGANTITATGAGNHINLGVVSTGTSITAPQTIHAAGASETITFATAAADNTVVTWGTGATSTVDGGASMIGIGANSTVNFGNNTGSGSEAAVLTGDLAGATTSGGTSTSGIAMTTLGNVHDAGGDLIVFNNATVEILAGTSAVNVSSASSLAQAIDLAAASAASSEGGTIAAHTGVIDWFQYGGNAYLVEAINDTATAATHSAFAATDELIKIIGSVSLANEVISAHTLTL
jgi:hypothetical protein